MELRLPYQINNAKKIVLKDGQFEMDLITRRKLFLICTYDMRAYWLIRVLNPRILKTPRGCGAQYRSI